MALARQEGSNYVTTMMTIRKLGYGATRAALAISAFATTGAALAEPPLLVPVLRAGLGMAEAAAALMPEAQMGFVGLARDERTHQPRAYLESLPGHHVSPHLRRSRLILRLDTWR